MTTPSTPNAPWDDERLAAAFSARATRVRTPQDLTATTSEVLRARRSSVLTWRRLLAPAAVVILAVGAVGGGLAILGSPRGSSDLVEFRDGPTPEVRTLDARTFSFDFPAEWLAYDASSPSPTLASIAVLGTEPVDARCGDDRHVDIRCVNERPLQAGEIRMNVSTGTYISGSFRDRPGISNGRTVRLEIDGQVAILDDVESAGDDYYGATELRHLYVERPGRANEIVLIDLIARDHGPDEIVRHMQLVIDSFRFVGTASPSPSGSWAGREAMGLPIVSVTDAITIRDAGVDDREIAVHGWIAPVVPVPCPFTLATSPVQPVCPDDQIVLMAEPESLVTRELDGYSRRAPTGPSFQIDFDDLDGSWQAGLPTATTTPPVEIAVVGHFDDRRSAACRVDLQAACRDRFVVDRVDSVDGETQPTSVVDLLEAAGTPFDDAKHTIEAVRPGVAILSAVHVEGDRELRRMEPALSDGRSDLVQQQAIWVLRVLDRGALGTYLLVDATGSIYELTAEGPVLVALSAPGERVSPTPTPIPGRDQSGGAS